MQTTVRNVYFQKSNMAAAAILTNGKIATAYLSLSLIHFIEISHVYAVPFFVSVCSVKIFQF